MIELREYQITVFVNNEEVKNEQDVKILEFLYGQHFVNIIDSKTDLIIDEDLESLSFCYGEIFVEIIKEKIN